jgi:hypothetical protein
MNDMQSNISNLTKEVSNFSKYISDPSSKDSNDDSFFSKIPFLNKFSSIELGDKKKYFIFALIPVFIFTLFWFIRPKFLRKIENEKEYLDYSTLIIITIVTSGIAIYIINKKI